MLVQVYVDDIIFGSTKKSLSTEFEGLMHKKFHMSSMGKLTFFLGLQVMQRDDGFFISQDKYVADILKKFVFSSVKTTSTPIETNKELLKDEEAEDMDVHLDRLMIGSSMFLTTSRPNIMFAVCAYARFQVTPKVSHLHAVNKIFKYLKGQPKLDLWYPKDSSFDLEAFSDCAMLELQTVVANSTTKAEYVAAANCYRQLKVNAARHTLTTASLKIVLLSLNLQLLVMVTTVGNVNGEAHIQAVVDKKKVIITEASIRRDLRFEDKGGVDYLSNEVIFEQLTLMRRSKKSRRKHRKEIEVPSPSSEIPNEEGVPITSNDPLPSGDDRMQLNELMILCTNLQKQVLNLEDAKTAQAKEIASLKKRVKKLEQKRKSRTLGIKRLRKVGSARRVESLIEASLGDQEDASK
nr:putative ribonuclease H-like domain-containing protein [Tanacetum cinerariifolium]